MGNSFQLFSIFAAQTRSPCMNILRTINLYLEHCKLDRNLSEKTILFYRIDLLQFRDYLLQHNISAPETINRQVIRLYYRSLTKYSISSIRRKLTVIKGYLYFLEIEEIIKSSPFRSLRFRLIDPWKAPQVLDLEEVEKILLYQAEEKEKVSKKYGKLYGEKLRDLLILEFLFATGVRVSELYKMKLKDVNLKKGSVLIRGKGKRERIAYIRNPETLMLFQEYYSFHESMIKSTGYFFNNRLGKPMAYSSVRHLICKVVNSVGIRKKVTPHTFRHTFATLFLEQEVDLKYIQHFLGHSSIRSTQIYAQVTSKQQLKVLSEKHPRNQFTIGRT